MGSGSPDVTNARIRTHARAFTALSLHTQSTRDCSRMPHINFYYLHSFNTTNFTNNAGGKTWLSSPNYKITSHDIQRSNPQHSCIQSLKITLNSLLNTFGYSKNNAHACTLPPWMSLFQSVVESAYMGHKSFVFVTQSFIIHNGRSTHLLNRDDPLKYVDEPLLPRPADSNLEEPSTSGTPLRPVLVCIPE